MQMQYLDTLRKGLIVCLIFWGGLCLSLNNEVGGVPRKGGSVLKTGILGN